MAEIRGLTVKRPWAGLIAQHGKCIENRSWDTKFRGTVLIHAGSGWDGAAEAWFDHVFAPFVPDDFWQPEQHPMGIVAVAELVDVCQGGPCDCGPWAMPGNRHWQFDNVRAVPEPVPATGSLGLWHPAPGIAEAVFEQFGEAL